MTTGKAAVLVGKGAIEIWDVPVVRPEPGGALIRVVLAGVCGSDAHIADGSAGAIPYPVVLGHEGVGVIEELAPGVATDFSGVPIKVGDRVYWAPTRLCHRCRSCVILEETPCLEARLLEDANKPNWGSFAEYVWLPAGHAFFRLPDEAHTDAVAALGCALPTAIRGFDQCGLPRGGERVVIQGAGPVGLSAALIAAQAGAGEIVVIDRPGVRLDAALKLGATRTIAVGDDIVDRRGFLRDQLGAEPADILVEATGALAAFPEGLPMLATHGKYLVLGIWAEGEQPFAPMALTTRNITVLGASFPKPKHYHAAMHLSSRLQDKIPLAQLITHRFPLREAAAALASGQSGNVVKAVIEPWGASA